MHAGQRKPDIWTQLLQNRVGNWSIDSIFRFDIVVDMFAIKLLKKFFEDKDNWSLDYFENKEKHNQNPYENSLAIGA